MSVTISQNLGYYDSSSYTFQYDTIWYTPSCTQLRRGVPAAFETHDLEEVVQFDPTQSFLFHHGRPGSNDAVGQNVHSIQPPLSRPPNPVARPSFSSSLATKEPPDINCMERTPLLHSSGGSTIINGREVKPCPG